MAGLNFDATQHDTSQSSTLPLGDYDLEVSASEVKPTSKGTGHILKLTIDVLAPEEFKGRKIFTNMNVANDNPVAEKIGKEDLAKMCRAIGISTITDSEEMHFKKFSAKVGLEKPQPGYDARNKIIKYHFPDEGAIPEAKVSDVQPAANDNRPAPANDNKAAAPAKKGVWGK